MMNIGRRTLGRWRRRGRILLIGMVGLLDQCRVHPSLSSFFLVYNYLVFVRLWIWKESGYRYPWHGARKVLGSETVCFSWGSFILCGSTHMSIPNSLVNILVMKYILHCRIACRMKMQKCNKGIGSSDSCRIKHKVRLVSQPLGTFPNWTITQND